MEKSAVFGPILSVGHQMVPYTARMLINAISAPTLTLRHQMVPYTARMLKSAISAPTFCTGPPNGPLYS